MLRIKLVRSLIGENKRNRATIAALGLRNINQVVMKADCPSIRGMIQHARHMVTVEVVEGEVTAKVVKPAAVVKAAPAKAKAPAKAAPAAAKPKPKAAKKVAEAKE